jgi:hypothetical protein
MNNLLKYNSGKFNSNINEYKSDAEYEGKLDYRDGFYINFPSGDISTLDEVPIRKGILKDLNDIGFDEQEKNYYEFDVSSASIRIEYDIEIYKRSYGIDDFIFTPVKAGVFFNVEEYDSDGEIIDNLDMEFEITDFGNYEEEKSLPLYITNIEVDIPDLKDYKGDNSAWWKDTSQWKWSFTLGN